MRSGDEAAFRVFVGRHHQAMVRLAARYVSSRAVAEEVTQETWLAVIRGLDRFEGRSSVRTWVFRILVNQARSHAAKEQRVSTVPAFGMADDGDGPVVDPSRFRATGHLAGYWATPPAPFSSVPEERLESAETRELIEQTIAALPARQQQVIGLRDIEGWTAEDVCEFLGLSEGNQRVLLHRARARVRAVREDHFGTVRSA